MKALKNTMLWAMFVLVVFVFSACTTAHYRAEGELGAFDKSQWLVVAPTSALENKMVSVEEKSMRVLLGDMLSAHGYRLQSDKKNEEPCMLIFSLDEPTKEFVGSYTSYNTTTTQTNTIGWVGNTYVRGSSTSTTTTPQTRTYTYQVTFKNLYATIGCPNKKGKYEAVWNGSMSAKLSDYAEHRENAISNLVQLIEEENFKDDLRIDIDTHLGHIREQNKRRHYLTIGGDIAFSAGSMNFGKYYFTNHWGSAESEDTSEVVAFSLPISLRVGYMYDPKKKATFGLNLVYQIDNMSDDPLWVDISAKTKRLGIEATTLIADSVLLGVGIAKNISSTAHIAIDNAYYKAEFDKSVNATYGLWRLEWHEHIPATNLYLTTGFHGGFSLSDIDYAGSVFAMSAGLLYKL